MALALGAVLALAAPAAGAVVPGTWTPVGASVDGTPVQDAPGLAGRVSAVAVLPGRSPVELAGTLGGIWRRTPRSSWTDVTGTGWPATAVSSLAVDRRHPKVIYAGTGYDVVDNWNVQPGAGILKSTDGGRSWSPLAASESLMRGYAVEGLAIDPHNDRVIVAAANNGLFRSTDAGNSWREVLPIAGAAYGNVAEVHLSVDPVTGRMLAGVAYSTGIQAHRGSGTFTTGHAIYVSNDGGLSWTPFAVDSSSASGNALVPGIATTTGRHPVTYAYALDVSGDSAAGLYISHNGRKWTRATTSNVITKFSIAQLAVDPRRPNHAYFAQESVPYGYVFGDAATTHLGHAGSYCKFGDFRTLSVGPSLTHSSHEALYGGHDGGTCFIDLRTGAYTDDNSGLISGLDFTASAASASVELSGAQDLGVDLNTGTGVSREIFHADGYGVLIDSSNPATMYAAVNPPPALGSQGFQVSRNGGQTWQRVALNPAPTDVFGSSLRLVQATGDPNVLILPTPGGTEYVSSDHGASWAARVVPLGGGDWVTAIRAAQFPGEPAPTIYAGTHLGRVFRSTDLGLTWTSPQVIFAPLAVTDFALDPAGSSGAASEHVYVSVGADTASEYAAGGTVGDVWESHDGGSSFTEVGVPLRNMAVNGLLLAGGTLLAATDYGVEVDNGGAWSAAGTGLPDVRVNDLVLSNDGAAFYAATYGRGTWEAPATVR